MSRPRARGVTLSGRTRRGRAAEAGPFPGGAWERESRIQDLGGTAYRGVFRSDAMAEDRDVQVHLLPDLAPPGRLAGGVAVAIDVLRASTTVIHALAAGCKCVRPCLEVDEARALAGT